PYAGFGLVAVDKQRYYFRELTPSSIPPNPPGDLTLQFNDLYSSLNLSWPQSIDPDSSDSTLTYEINYSTSTEAGFSTSTWQSVGGNLSAGTSVIFGNSYKIGVRAVDDFGNVSSPVERNWNSPSGFVPLPYQSNASERIGNSDGSGQRILISATSSIGRVAMIMGNGSGVYSRTQVYVGIYGDTGGSRGNLLAISTPIEEDWPQESGPIFSKRSHIFNFPQPVNLSGGNYYWLVPTTSAYNLSSIYGASTNLYPDGHWSGNPGADAYFYIR
ncbi:MAG: hypothetical protein V1856_01965, partial [Candidatus Liptonbacteria bacterium]